MTKTTERIMRMQTERQKRLAGITQEWGREGKRTLDYAMALAENSEADLDIVEHFMKEEA